MSAFVDNPLAHVRSMIVKLGTGVLRDQQGKPDLAYLSAVAMQVHAAIQAGKQVTLVTSGAVGSGMSELGLTDRPEDLATLQAVAAVGQRRLMDAWADAFSPLNLHVAQVLLTREDFDDRGRFLNVRNTLAACHRLGVVPIVNENDTVSTHELVAIGFGDNDQLSASLSAAVMTDLLVLMTVTDGLLDASGQPIRRVSDIDAVAAHVTPATSSLGRGGMESKLHAARRVTAAGELLAIVAGRSPQVLTRLLAGEAVGTLFLPRGERRVGKGRWIAAARPEGRLHVDAGAVRALVEKQRSLLPIGIQRVEGHFARGDVVAIVGPDAQVIGTGLTNYDAADLQQVLCRRSEEVRTLLGSRAYDEAVHRDNLVIRE